MNRTRTFAGMGLALALGAGAGAAAAGKPADTLAPDALDRPAETSVREAERSAARAAGMSGHAGHVAHGRYRHTDAGREEAPTASPEHHHHEMPSPSPAPKGDER